MGSDYGLLDVRFPDFRARHLFTAKLRLVIFIGYWAFCLVLYPWVLTLDEPIMLYISGTFAVTTVCYFFILRNIYPLFFFVIELASDVAAHTILVYLTGGAKSNFYTIYIIYCAAGGLFYNYRVSIAISLLALFFYTSLLLFLHQGWLPEFTLSLGEPGFLSGLGPLQNLGLLILFLLVAIYGIWIANYFTQIREKALEDKNRELSALTNEHAVLIAELKQKNVELERVSRIKSEFLATMSHELRTPLTAIIGFSELLGEEMMGSLNDEQKESVKEIFVNGENLLQMINGLLDLEKIESGKMELSKSPAEMKSLLERVQRMMSSLLQKKRHSLKVNISPDFPIVNVDEKKIQQILLNLLSNAIKFTPDGGQLGISVRFLNEKDRKGFEVSVSDTGIGIGSADQQKIFEPFRQVDSSFTRQYQGTGLGLALVKQFVDMHGGEIRVESEVGKGSRFFFFIPA